MKRFTIHDYQYCRNTKNPRPRKKKESVCFTEKGFVYVIKGIDKYKIGMSHDPYKRSKRFFGNLFIIIPTDNMFELEKQIHNKFANKRGYFGEWFRLDNEDIEYLHTLLLLRQ